MLTMALSIASTTAATLAQVLPVNSPMPAAMMTTPPIRWTHPHVDQSTCTVSWESPTW